MRNIKLTDEQAEWLEGILERELDDEYIDPDEGGDYYARTLEVYKAIQRKPRHFIDGLILQDLIGKREEQLKEIKSKKED